MENLEQIINNSRSLINENFIPENIKKNLEIIGTKANINKGLCTVLITLLYYKYLHPDQDVRNHQKQIPNGFSGRSFDTRHVTPILKKLRLPAMNESGWLTRSLEQASPYDFNYPGKISNKLRRPFLESLDYLEKQPNQALSMLKYLLYFVIQVAKENCIEIHPLENPEKLTINKIINALEKQFSTNYKTHNGAKLPVLAFHAIYTCLINEMKRYEGCTLAELSSLTACDRNNKASGDIEIFKNKELYEAIEIKLDKKIDAQILRVAQEKIYKWNPERYYILSVYGIEEAEHEEIDNIVLEVSHNHGCQIIINGLIPTIKYYLRLISNLSEFVTLYSKSIEIDHELQIIHKQVWNEIIKEYNL